MDRSDPQRQQEADERLGCEWLSRIALRDRGAMERFYLLHQARVFRLAQARLDDSAAATDVLVAVMLRVWREAQRLVNEPSPRLLALRLTLEALPSIVEPGGPRTLPIRCGSQPARKDRKAAFDASLVQSAMRRMAARDRVLVHLCFHENLSDEAIAGLLCEGRESVSDALHWARQRLFARLAVMVPAGLGAAA